MFLVKLDNLHLLFLVTLNYYLIPGLLFLIVQKNLEHLQSIFTKYSLKRNIDSARHLPLIKDVVMPQHFHRQSLQFTSYALCNSKSNGILVLYIVQMVLASRSLCSLLFWVNLEHRAKSEQSSISVLSSHERTSNHSQFPIKS